MSGWDREPRCSSSGYEAAPGQTIAVTASASWRSVDTSKTWVPRVAQEHVAALAGRLGLSAVVAPAGSSAEHLARLRDAAAPARVETADQVAGAVVETRDPAAVRAARAALDAAGRRLDPVVVQVPVAIGRTMNEAVARVERDPGLAHDPGLRERGLFGTFEQAQDQVLALARAGATQPRLVLADEIDVADLLAQVRALVVGATPAVHARG